jgi:hypothetical protein
MQPFTYLEAASVPDALRLVTEHPGARFLAGGTTLVDLMKSGPEHPSLVIDINHLHQLRQIELDITGGVIRLGALSRMSQVAAHSDVRRRFPVIAEALLFAASGQLRNWHRSEETCSSGRGVITFAIGRSPATSASRAPGAELSKAKIECLQCWARPITASRAIPATSQWRLRRSTQ